MSKEKSPSELAFDRRFKVAKVLENALPSLREGMMRNFDRMNFGTDEDFDEYLTEVSVLVGYKENPEQSKPNVINADLPVDKSKVSSNVNAFIDSKKADYQDPFGGKTGGENPYQVK